MNNKERAQIYAWLMKEIKFRIEEIDRIQSRLTIAKIAEESCYLQLRMICETIALGCLVIHGDRPALQTMKLKTKYQADEIIKRIEEIHDLFYPIPLIEKTVDGVVMAINSKSEFLTKEDLISLYVHSGDKLHRGTLKNLFARPVKKADFDIILGWRNKIVNLLNIHKIVSGDERDECWIWMKDAETGEVRWAIMKHEGKYETFAEMQAAAKRIQSRKAPQ